MRIPTPPYFVYDNVNYTRVAFFDPVDAIEYIVQLGGPCNYIEGYDEYDCLDSTGTTIKLKELEAAMMNSTQLNKTTPNKHVVEIHTDGACSGNPGPGGYCGIIVFHGKNNTKVEKTVRGYSIGTTNNAMELKAVIEALKALTAPCEVTVYTDSQYLCTCSKHTKPWFDRPDRPNKDLWFEYLETCLAGKHNVSFQKVKGHAGEEYNERCDRVAKEQVKKAFHVIYEQQKKLIY